MLTTYKLLPRTDHKNETKTFHHWLVTVGGGGVDFRRPGPQALAPGKHTIVFDFTYDGPGPGKGGTGVLKVGWRGRRHAEDAAHHPVRVAVL